MSETHWQRMSRLLAELHAKERARAAARESILRSNPPQCVLNKLAEMDRLYGADRALEVRNLEQLIQTAAAEYGITFEPTATRDDKLLIVAAAKDEREGRV